MKTHLKPETVCEDMNGQLAEGFDLDVEAKLRCKSTRGQTDLERWEAKLRCKSTRGQTDLERWEAIYRLLFPGEVVPFPCKSIISKNLHESILAYFLS